MIHIEPPEVQALSREALGLHFTPADLAALQVAAAEMAARAQEMREANAHLRERNRAAWDWEARAALREDLERQRELLSRLQRVGYALISRPVEAFSGPG